MKKAFYLLLIPFALQAQHRTSLFDSYMQKQASLYAFNGNVLVAKSGNIIYEKSFGYADFDTKEKLEKNSVFDCGSIAKEFTAMGILLLKDKGKISYSDTLRQFFPELPYYNITIQQLLTHTSGMPDGFDVVENSFDHNKIASNDDLVRLLASEKPPLLFQPGENLMYSGTAFNLLACIIQKISGQSYNAYMYEKVFKPLGMKNTRVANGPRSAKTIPGYVSGFAYSNSLKKYIRSDSLHTGWTTYLAGITGEGMIITTTEDLLKWDRALKNYTLLSKTTQDAMLSRQAERKNIPIIQFGYGMRIGKSDFGDCIFHNGYYPGYKCQHIRYTREDVTVIVLSNNESQSEFIADGLAGIALDKEIAIPYAHTEKPAGDAIGKYTGKYLMQLTRPPYMALFPVELIVVNDKLYIHPAQGNDIEMKPESGVKFFFGDKTDQQLEFETGNDGYPVKAWHIAWGVRRELKKVD